MKKEKKAIKISFIRKDGKLTEGIYIFKEPNKWYPAVYFRKSKWVDNGIYNAILEYLFGNY
jgi:hypothetical protein